MNTQTKTLLQHLTHTTTSVDWDSVYRELLPKVYRYFCYRVGEGQVAEDLTATTFEKAWRKRHRYRKDAGAFLTWIFTIARNVAIDYFRTARDTIDLDVVEMKVGLEPSPEIALEQREHFARLAQHIAKLSMREQEILALKYGADMRHDSIANITGLSASNVGVIAHRAVKKLRVALEKDV